MYHCDASSGSRTPIRRPLGRQTVKGRRQVSGNPEFRRRPVTIRCSVRAPFHLEGVVSPGQDTASWLVPAQIFPERGTEGQISASVSDIFCEMATHSALPRLLGPQLQGKGRLVESSSISADVIGIYFSAHWCPPCRQFTPVLVRRYNELKAAGKSLEIVFVSGDRDAHSFQEYYDSMPWLAIPFENQMQVRSLHHTFHVSGIPSLVFVDRSGKLIEKNGREKVNDPAFIRMIPDSVDEDIRGLTVDAAIDAVSNDAGITREAALHAYKTIIRVISNIVQNPGDPKYLELKKSNAAVQSKIGNPKFIRILKLSGFKERPESYKCNEDVDVSKMKEVRDTLNSIVMSLEG